MAKQEYYNQGQPLSPEQLRQLKKAFNEAFAPLRETLTKAPSSEPRLKKDYIHPPYDENGPIKECLKESLNAHAMDSFNQFSNCEG